MNSEKKTPDKPLQTLAAVLRALRPYLPPGFKKTSERGALGYLYENKLWVDVLGVCEWNASTEEKSNCRAVRLRVVPSSQYRPALRGMRPLGGIRSRFYKPSKKTGEFNVAMIGARIQQCLEDIAQMDALTTREQEEQKQDKLAAAALKEHLRKFIVGIGMSEEIVTEYGHYPVLEGQESARPCAKVSNTAKTVQVSVDGLTLNEAQRILTEIGKACVR